jgi:hypothetical protein
MVDINFKCLVVAMNKSLSRYVEHRRKFYQIHVSTFWFCVMFKCDKSFVALSKKFSM